MQTSVSKGVLTGQGFGMRNAHTPIGQNDDGWEGLSESDGQTPVNGVVRITAKREEKPFGFLEEEVSGEHRFNEGGRTLGNQKQTF